METSLHRQLKAVYSPEATTREVRLDSYRIDAIADDVLIEIQQASLSAIRDKIRDLVQSHSVLVVKPLAVRKYLRKRNRQGGKILSARYSPRRQQAVDVFDDLVHFVNVFPHPNLTLDILLTEQEEERVPAARRRRRGKDYRTIDRSLRAVTGTVRLSSAADLCRLLPVKLPREFTTADLAEAAGIQRWLAQKACYCLRQTGAAEAVGRQGNTVVYQLVEPAAGDIPHAGCSVPECAAVEAADICPAA